MDRVETEDTSLQHESNHIAINSLASQCATRHPVNHFRHPIQDASHFFHLDLTHARTHAQSVRARHVFDLARGQAPLADHTQALFRRHGYELT